MFKIESEVPMPSGRGKWSKFSETFKKMKVGDSIFIESNPEVVGARQAFNQLIKRNPTYKNWGYTARKENSGGYRLWRIK